MLKKVKFPGYGELWQGDCLELMKKIPKQTVDMVFADLPYGTTRCEWDVLIAWEPLWEHLLRATSEKASFVFTSSQPFTTDLIQSQRNIFRYCLVWEKNIPSMFLDANRKPLKSHEDIVVFYKKLGTYNPQGLKYYGKKSDRGTGTGNHVGDVANNCRIQTHRNYPRSVLRFNRGSPKSTKHNTEKPLALLSYLIKTYSNSGDLVLDPVCGSGTTACACIDTGREFLCIEKDPKIFEVAEKRIRNYLRNFKNSFAKAFV